MFGLEAKARLLALDENIRHQQSAHRQRLSTAPPVEKISYKELRARARFRSWLRLSAFGRIFITPKRLSKSARNERRKISAAYFNGSALGLVGVGLFPVMFRLVQNHPDLVYSVNPLDLVRAITAVDLDVMVTAFFGSALFHKAALSSLNRMED